MSMKQQAEQNLIDSEALKQIISELPRSNSWGGGTTIRPAKTNQVIPAYTDTELTVEGDADLLPKNIRKGINLFGVAGAMEEGVIGVDYGTVVNEYITDITVSHGLRKVPSVAFLLSKNPADVSSISYSIASFSGYELRATTSVSNLRVAYNPPELTNKTITFKAVTGFDRGTYYWFAIA